MKKWILALIAALAIGTHVSTAETLINIEEAAEVSRLQLQLDGTASARIFARICDNCELLTLRADNNTRVVRGQARLSLAQAADLKNKGATVLFNPSTLRVTRIIFWN